MKKTVIIGVIIIIISLAIVSVISMNTENQEFLLDEDEIIDELISLEDDSGMEESKTGRNISVELTESVGLKSP